MNARAVMLLWTSLGALSLSSYVSVLHGAEETPPTAPQTAEPATTDTAPAAAAADSAAPAEEDSFLSDYSKLQPAPDNPFDEFYLSPDASKFASRYTAVMIDQPEIFIHPDSSYKGIKPDDIKTIADELRDRVSTELKNGGYQIVDQPGPNVMYVRLAVGDLKVKKKKRPILAYTPVGAVVHAGKGAVQGVTSKVELENMKIEGEVLDSTTNEQLGALTTSRGSLSSAPVDPKKELTWKELDHIFSSIGKRLRCRLDNAKPGQSQQQNCGAIGLEPAATAKAGS